MKIRLAILELFYGTHGRLGMAKLTVAAFQPSVMNTTKLESALNILIGSRQMIGKLRPAAMFRYY
jgi:hypothetical protein